MELTRLLLTSAVDLAEALAWPVTILLLARMFRPELGSVLSRVINLLEDILHRLRELSLPGAKLRLESRTERMPDLGSIEETAPISENDDRADRI